MTGALLLASVIWGSGAVFMQVCIDGGIETGLQMFFRFWIGALCLGALVHKKLRQINRRLLLCGALCGTLLFFSFFISIVILLLLPFLKYYFSHCVIYFIILKYLIYDNTLIL